MDAKEILKQLTLEEKIYLLQAKDNWNLNGVSRLGVPETYLTDGPNGVRASGEDLSDGCPATAVPVESILSSAWDTELVERIGQMLAEESHHYNVGVLLGPGVNAKRSPLAGRNFEYYSEDPFLSGKLAAAMIRGVQSRGVGTSLKHYVANDQETRRFTSNATVDERTLRELLLASFEIAIREGKPWTIMAAYPKLRGTYLSENKYVLKDILRDEFGYEGVVLTDWGACQNKVAAHKNGLDLETGSFASAGEMFDAVASGEITEEEIDLHAGRVLELILKVAEGKETAAKEAGTELDWVSHHAVAKEAAVRSMVLLKNEEGLLPLQKKSKIAVIGAFAKEPRYCGGGSSGVIPKTLDIPLDCVSAYADVSYAAGYEEEVTTQVLIEEAVKAAEGKDAVILFTGTTAAGESEGADRINFALPESQMVLLRALKEANPNLVVCNFSGAAVELAEVDATAKAVLHCGLPGEAGGSAMADLLFGVRSPSGKLSESFPVCIEQTPAFPYFPGDGDEITYTEGLLQGYRYYDTKKIPVQYPFGYGLSYTEFAYSDMQVSTNCLHNGETLTVSLNVTNTGKVAGTEIVQIYVADEESYLIRPKKELKGFARISLLPGETGTVKISLDERAFAYFVPHIGRFAVESGRFRIMAAASSADIRLEKEIWFASSDEVRRLLTLDSSMKEFLNDDRYAEVTNRVYEELGITENHPMFPVLASMKLKHFPSVLMYIQVPLDISTRYQQEILKAGHNHQ